MANKEQKGSKQKKKLPKDKKNKPKSDYKASLGK